MHNFLFTSLFVIFFISFSVAIAEDFTFEPFGNALRLTGWTGTDKIICVPAEKGGKPVTVIGSGAFSGADADTISLPESIQTIEEGAFRGSLLREIHFSTGLTEIGANAFADCVNLVGAALPESVQRLGDHAFSGCSSLLYVTLPKNVTIPEGDPFAGCSSLVSLPMPAEQPYLLLNGAVLTSRTDGRIISTLSALLSSKEEEKP